MDIGQKVKQVGKKILLIGIGLGLVASLSSCSFPRFQLKGIVQAGSEKSGYSWYQISLKNHNKEERDYGKTLEARFYDNNFDLKKVREYVKPEKELVLTGTPVIAWGKSDYEWRILRIDN
ncbi:MAG: hypothetical protein KJ968_05675 [Nanoarchaeota archaeon]|nr:hypothetical protein [Nanoarchaeota archaeon]